jgi:serine phosphatase RsbU (regulator of sigma subunit)
LESDLFHKESLHLFANRCRCGHPSRIWKSLRLPCGEGGIASIYKPFGEVGGDFFQILPLEDGSVLVAIGDVSGKGMPAAMTVALLVGTLRTLADSTQSPGEILKAMNQRMIGRTNGGFTTCMVLRADPYGNLAIANAGHISPYKNGTELDVDNGLPLGLVEGATYCESPFNLHPNEQLTFLTDGVVEARSKSGELFGFDRTAAIASKSAEFIALAAQSFGQDDDVTVLTLTRWPVGERSTGQELLQPRSPALA